MVVVQLTQWSLPVPEIHSLITVIDRLCGNNECCKTHLLKRRKWRKRGWEWLFKEMWIILNSSIRRDRIAFCTTSSRSPNFGVFKDQQFLLLLFTIFEFAVFFNFADFWPPISILTSSENLSRSQNADALTIIFWRL